MPLQHTPGCTHFTWRLRRHYTCVSLRTICVTIRGALQRQIQHLVHVIDRRSQYGLVPVGFDSARMIFLPLPRLAPSSSIGGSSNALQTRTFWDSRPRSHHDPPALKASTCAVKYFVLSQLQDLHSDEAPFHNFSPATCNRQFECPKGPTFQ